MKQNLLEKVEVTGYVSCVLFVLLCFYYVSGKWMGCWLQYAGVGHVLRVK